MKRIFSLASVMLGASLGSLASSGRRVLTVDREWPVSTKRRHVAPTACQKRRSKYMPHQGAKERERAKRCYYSEYLNQQFVDYWIAHPMNIILSSDQCHERSMPTICQRAR